MVHYRHTIPKNPEMTAEEIEEKKRIVMGLNLSENTLVMDTSRPLEETCADIMEAIWKIL